MDKPKAAGEGPVTLDRVGGADYWWCACGRSSNQPWCDGSHMVAGKSPLKFVAGVSGSAMLCTCKLSADPPWCDGSHDCRPEAQGRQPGQVSLTAGEKYWWCACGLSADQPWCDGSHKVLGLSPLRFKAEQNGPARLCLCKRTANPPYCDGSHDE